MGQSVACIFVGYLEEMFFEDYEHSTQLLCKRYTEDIVGASSCPEKELQWFFVHFTNFNSSITYSYAISNNTVTFLDLQMTIDSNHIKSCAHFIPADYTIILYFHPVIHLHATNPFNFHNCCVSNFVVLTIMISLRSQIKSRITFLLANTTSISLIQPTKMFTQFTERIFLCHLLKRFLLIIFLYFFNSTLQLIWYVASF